MITHSFDSVDPMRTALSLALTATVRYKLGINDFIIDMTPLVYNPENFMPIRGFVLKMKDLKAVRMNTVFNIEKFQDESAFVDEYNAFINLVNELANEVYSHYQLSLNL